MGANLNVNVTVNLLSGAPAVSIQVLGNPLDVFEGAAFSGGSRIRFYESPNDVTADSDLSAEEKAAGAAAFAQEPHSPKIAIGRTTKSSVDYDNLATDLAAIVVESQEWYGLAIGSRVEADINATAAWVETNGVGPFLAQSSDAAFADGTAGNVGEDLNSAGYANSSVVYHATDAAYLDFSALSKGLAVDPAVAASIWAYINLAGIVPDTITTTQKTNIEGVKGNVYLPFYGVGALWPGWLANGDYIDKRITNDWIAKRSAERIAQLLLDTSNRRRKIAFTDKGLALLVSPVRALLKQGVDAEHFEPGSIDFTTPKRADYSAGQIAARAITFTAKAEYAGAVQSVTFNVAVFVAA